jgi:hypothetical protein
VPVVLDACVTAALFGTPLSYNFQPSKSNASSKYLFYRAESMDVDAYDLTGGSVRIEHNSSHSFRGLDSSLRMGTNNTVQRLSVAPLTVPPVHPPTHQFAKPQEASATATCSPPHRQAQPPNQ